MKKRQDKNKAKQSKTKQKKHMKKKKKEEIVNDKLWGRMRKQTNK